MSDGEYHATREGLRASGLDHTPMAPDSQPTPGAAPWERFSAPPPDDSGLHRWQAEPPAEPKGPRKSAPKGRMSRRRRRSVSPT